MTDSLFAEEVKEDQVDWMNEVARTLMRAARNWKEFYFILNRSLPRFSDTLELPFEDTRAMEALPIKANCSYVVTKATH